MKTHSFKAFIFVLFFSVKTLLSANFILSEAHTASYEQPAVTKEVVQLDEEPSYLPTDSEEPQEFSYWQEFFRMMLILGVILCGILVLAWFLKNFLNKRIKQVNQQNRIKVLERRNLSQKSMLYLVEVAGKELLISDSASGGVRLLLECPEEREEPTDEVSKTNSIASRFSFTQILQRKLSNKALKPYYNPKNIKSDYEIHEEN